MSITENFLGIFMRDKIRVKHEDDLLTISINGAIDLITGIASELADFLEKFDTSYPSVRNLDYDFSKVKFLDSTGIGALVVFVKDHSDVNVNIYNASEKIFKLLNIAKLDSVMNVNMQGKTQ